MPKRNAAPKPLEDVRDLPSEPPAGLTRAVAKSGSFSDRAPFVQRDQALIDLAELVGHLGTVHRSQLPGLVEDALKRIEALRAL